MIITITGITGAGKTLYCIGLILKLQKENQKRIEKGEEPRQIYADIKGLRINGVLPSPEDWRETPENSIIFYDEAPLKHPRFAYAGRKFSDDPIVRQMAENRHENKDLYFITQDPQFLNNTIAKLVWRQYYVKRISGSNASSIYSWDKYIPNPTTDAIQKQAVERDTFFFDKSHYDLYDSAVEHSVKFRLPKKFIFAFLGIFIMMFFSVKLLFASGFIDTAKKANVNALTGDKVTQVPKTSIQSQAPNPLITPQQIIQNPEQTQNRALTVEDFKPAVPDMPWTAPIYKNVASIQNFPRFAGCMSTKKKCTCYTQQATAIEVSLSQCKAVIDHNQMPFNAFRRDTENVPVPIPDPESENIKTEQNHSVVIVGQQQESDLNVLDSQKSAAMANPIITK